MIGASSIAGSPLGGAVALAAGVTAVTSDSAASYFILAKVSADGVAAYAIRAAVAADASASYAILAVGAVASDSNASYAIRAAVAADCVASYSISAGSNPTAAQIAAAVVAALNATTIPVDAKKMNGAVILGDGSSGNLWRGV